jgi:hypothetical protein
MKKKSAFESSVKTAIFASALLCLPLLAPAVTHAAEIDAIQDIKPMTKAQLAKYRGGFKIGGYEFAMGVDIKGWVDGVLKTSMNITVGDLAGAMAGNSKLQVAPGGSVSEGDGSSHGSSSFANAPDLGGITQVQVDTPDQLAKLLTENQALLNTVITNTKDGVKIDQTTNMTVVVANYKDITQTPGFSSLPNLIPQLANSGFTGLR